jgi:general stress protein 26
MPWYEFVFEDEHGRKSSEIEQNLNAAWLSVMPPAYMKHIKAPNYKLVQVKWRDIEMWNQNSNYSPSEFTG